MRPTVVGSACLIALTACGGAQGNRAAAGDLPADVAAYAGHDTNGVPHYTTRSFTSDERVLLRSVYGVEDPERLYLSDSTAAGVLKYDTNRKNCWTCYVNSYRIGFVSIRRPGESWKELERRIGA